MWYIVNWIIAILYFVVCHLVMLPGSNVLKMLLHGLSLVLLNSLISHSATRHFNSCPCTSTSQLASLSILHHISPCTDQLLTQGTLTPKISSFRFFIIVLPSINQRFTSTIVSHMMPQSYGMISHRLSAVLQNLSCFISRLKAYLFQKFFPP